MATARTFAGSGTWRSGRPDAVRGRGLGIWNSSFTFGQFLSAGFAGAVLGRPDATILDAFAWAGVAALTAASVTALGAQAADRPARFRPGSKPIHTLRPSSTWHRPRR